jgi:hypothetical protein
MEINMQTPLEKRRQGYLAYFKDGVADGLIYGEIDETKRFSTYYKQGYDYGLTLFEEQQNQPNEVIYETWERGNGRKI